MHLIKPEKYQEQKIIGNSFKYQTLKKASNL